jgi:hypothetical protein
LLSRHAQSCAPEQLGFHVFSSLVLSTKCFFLFSFCWFCPSGSKVDTRDIVLHPEMGQSLVSI